MRLEFTANALKSINKNFDKKQSDFIFDKLALFARNYNEITQTKQVEKLTNSRISRFKISNDIRAFFIAFYENQDGTIIILDVTSRENAYDNKKLRTLDKQADNELNKRKPIFPKR